MLLESYKFKPVIFYILILFLSIDCFYFYGRAGELVIFLLLQTSLHEQCLSRRNGSTFAITRFCRLSASNSLIKFASSGFKTKKHPFLRMSVFSFMVGPERIELSRHCCHQILSLARLPIPPQPHKNYTTLIADIF